MSMICLIRSIGQRSAVCCAVCRAVGKVERISVPDLKLSRMSSLAKNGYE